MVRDYLSQMSSIDWGILGFCLMLCLFFVGVLIDYKLHPDDYHTGR